MLRLSKSSLSLPLMIKTLRPAGLLPQRSNSSRVARSPCDWKVIRALESRLISMLRCWLN